MIALELYSIIFLVLVVCVWSFVRNDNERPSTRPHLRIRTASRRLAWSWYEEETFQGYR